MYEWLAFALLWDVVWFVLFVLKPHLRNQMVWMSIFTAITGLAEPIFVSRYWNPPSLFNLSSTIHFDIESVIFSWGTGGIGSVLYEVLLNTKHRKMAPEEYKQERRWLHMFSLLAMPVIFLSLSFLTNLNTIYSVSIALTTGAIAAVACRPDLAKNTILGGALFTALYFLLFSAIILVFPNFLNSWNLEALSGVLILKVPLEELMFAFTFGMMWSSVY
jgi:hypothetical protein